ncbi:hypothetical protein BOX15_Mlig017218g1 [Macrostomum lignano]|uniref:Tetraspanin n=2 Tax=Macrostomum lignano TaxID=282301 RepID=A0A1I8HQ67_9PLAT|nr:hypothetical protein BOX15_Mlig017218g1 [Macrostomum lignano]
MIRNLPPLFWKITPLVIAGMFIVSGLGLIIFGSVTYNKTVNEEDDVLGFIEAGFKTGSTLTISVGVIDFFIGLFGLGVALLNARWLHKVYSGFLIFMLLGNLITFYTLTTSANEELREITNLLKDAVQNLYGNNTRNDGQEFTDLVNKLMSETPCCGFSGNEKENIFLKTSWHENIKTKFSTINLPDQCCTTHSDKCREATDIADARNAGHVHPTDCINELYKDYGRELFAVFVEVTLSTIMQIVSGVYTVLLLMYGPETKD